MTSHGEHSGHVAVKASDVRFFWIEGEGLREDRHYHWCVDCAWATVAVWHGGRLVSSAAPPPGAGDTAWVRRTLEEHLPGPAWHPGDVDSPTDETTQKRWLCAVCSDYIPRPEALRLPADDESCAKCGCAREMHIQSVRRAFRPGAGDGRCSSAGRSPPAASSSGRAARPTAWDPS